MKKTMTILLIMMLLLPLMAEEFSIDVDQAVEMALENNLSLQSNAIDLRTKKRAMDSAWNAFIPSINASVGLTQSDKLFGDPAINPYTFAEQEASTSMSVGLNMSLPINMALGNGIKQTILDYEAGQLSYEVASRQLEVNIQKQFWGIKTQQASVELERNNIETLEKRYQQTLINFENGLVPELSVLSSRVSLENQRPKLNQNLAELESSLAFFKFLLGLDQQDNLTLLGDLNADLLDPLDSAQLVGQFLNQRLDIQQINQQLRSLENTKTMTSLYNLTPILNLGLSWGSQVSDEPFNSDSWDPFYDNLSLSATLVIPLDGFIPRSSKDVQIRELQDGLDSLNLARQQALENASIEINNLVRKLETSRITLEAYGYSVELADRNYRLTNEAYQLGTVELLEVQTAQDQLYQAQFAVLFERFNYQSTLLDLELALNSKIEEIR
ncbi:MAG: TolC family protein [Spirochaetaceae bacterium]|jgi:outer membrane protein TolC|nr:TolC family protein [Spirochaetaceae bacterium]